MKPFRTAPKQPRHSLARNLVYSVIKAGATVVCPVLSFMYASRIFLTDGIGQISFAKSFTAYFTMLAMLGIVNYGTREAAKVRDDREKLSHLSGELMALNAVSAVAAFALFAGIIQLFPALQPYRLLLLINALSIVLTGAGMDWLYAAVEDYRFLTLRTCAAQGMGFALIILLVHDAEDIFLYAIIQTVASVGANIVNLVHAQKYIDFRLPQLDKVKRHLRPVLVIFAMTLFVQAFTNFATTILTILAGDAANGLYTAANRMCDVLSQGIAAAVMVFMPRFSRSAQRHDQGTIEKLSADAVNIILAVSIPTAVGLIYFAKPIVLLFSGEAFAEAAFTSQLLALRVILSPLNTFIVLYLFISLSKEKWNLLSTGSAALISFSFNFLLIPVLQHNGAAVAMVAAEAVELVINMLLLRRVTKLHECFAQVWQYLCGCVAVLAICCGTAMAIANPLLHMGVAVPLSVAVYFGVLIVVRNRCAVRVEKVLTDILACRFRKNAS